jgi:hypothetical protein
MIYMYGLPGRKAYTELGDVLDIKKITVKEKNGYDVLKQAVKTNTMQFMQAQYAARRGSTMSNLYIIIGGKNDDLKNFEEEVKQLSPNSKVSRKQNINLVVSELERKTVYPSKVLIN